MEISQKVPYDLSDIEASLIGPRFLFLLEVDNEKYVALMATRTRLEFLEYSFQQAVTGWLPLAAVGTAAVTNSTQAAYLEKQPITITSVSDVDISDNALGFGSNKNNLMQVFYGIKPSYCAVNRRFPSNPVDILPESQLFPRSSYPYVSGANGKTSPYYHPSKKTEFMSIINNVVTFDLANTVSFSIQPEMMFVLNNIITKPITKKDTVVRMLENQGIPRKIVQLGSIYGSVPWDDTSYGGAKVFKASDLGVD